MSSGEFTAKGESPVVGYRAAEFDQSVTESVTGKKVNKINDKMLLFTLLHSFLESRYRLNKKHIT